MTNTKNGKTKKKLKNTCRTKVQNAKKLNILNKTKNTNKY